MASRNLVNLVRLQDEELEVAGVLGTTLLEANKGLKETLEKVESQYEAVVSERYEESIKAGAFRKRISKLQHYLEMSEEHNGHLIKENTTLRDALHKSEMNCKSVQMELDRAILTNQDETGGRQRMQSWATELPKPRRFDNLVLPVEQGQVNSHGRTQQPRERRQAAVSTVDASVFANMEQPEPLISGLKLLRLPQRRSSLQKLKAYGFKLRRSQSMIEKSLIEPLVANEDDSDSEESEAPSIETKEEEVLSASKLIQVPNERSMLMSEDDVAVTESPLYTHFHLTLQAVKYHLEQTGVYYEVRGKEATALYTQALEVPTYQWWSFIRDTLLTLEPREYIFTCNHHKAMVASNLLQY